MPNPTDYGMTIEQILQAQIETATELAGVLEREALAIKSRNAETLISLAPEKLKGLQRLEELEQSRLQMASNTQISSDAESRLWEQMLEIVNACKRENQLNGIMLNLRQQHIQRAMDLIANRDAAAIVYSPDGSTNRTAGHSHTSVSA